MFRSLLTECTSIGLLSVIYSTFIVGPLLLLSREYPGQNGPQKFRQQIHDAFMKNKDETDPKKIKALLAHGRYVAKEVEALYSLKKYRAMKQRYYD